MSRVNCRVGVSQNCQAIFHSRVRQEAGSGARPLVMHRRSVRSRSKKQDQEPVSRAAVL